MVGWAVAGAAVGLVESGGREGGATGRDGALSAVAVGVDSLCRKRPVKPPDIAGAGAPPRKLLSAVSVGLTVGFTVTMIRLPSALMVYG
jgi:hypothetical protein